MPAPAYPTVKPPDGKIWQWNEDTEQWLLVADPNWRKDQGGGDRPLPTPPTPPAPYVPVDGSPAEAPKPGYRWWTPGYRSGLDANGNAAGWAHQGWQQIPINWTQADIDKWQGRPTPYVGPNDKPVAPATVQTSVFTPTAPANIPAPGVTSNVPKTAQSVYGGNVTAPQAGMPAKWKPFSWSRSAKDVGSNKRARFSWKPPKPRV
jgi:hypothetical protein